MKKALLLISILSLLVVILVLYSLNLFGIRISRWRFPDPALRSAVHTYVDKDKNDVLSKKELEDAKILIIYGECNDFSGIKYLKNIERLSLHDCSDLSGLEKLTNLKDLSFIGQCPDLSSLENMADLETIEFWNVEFSETFVLENNIPVKNVIIHSCIFENGIIFKNDSVESVEFGYCGNGECVANGDLIFKDCASLNSFRAEFDTYYFDIEQEQSCNIDLSGCNNLDWLMIWSEDKQRVPSINLSNCSMLNSFTIYDLHYGDEVADINVNISGSPNINIAKLATGIKELNISDCPHLIAASEQTPHEGEYHSGIVYECEEGRIESDNEQLVFIK